jgi:hypothetical protein
MTRITGHMNTNIHLGLNHIHFCLEWELFRTKVVEKITTHILCSVTFPWKLCHLWDDLEKYGEWLFWGSSLNGAFCVMRLCNVLSVLGADLH